MTYLPKKIIILISGSFLKANYWDLWKTTFEKQGYRVYMPDLINTEPSIFYKKEKKQDELYSIVRNYENFIEHLDQKPIGIGHALGGLIIQLLLQRDVLKAGVALHSFPPNDEFPFKYALITSYWNLLRVFETNKIINRIGFKIWQKKITNNLSYEQQLATYTKYAIPESPKLLRSTLKKNVHIDFKTAIPPLLFIAGGSDLLIPASINYTNFLKYAQAKQPVFYKEFEHQNHYMMCRPLGHETLIYIAEWLLMIDFKKE